MRKFYTVISSFVDVTTGKRIRPEDGPVELDDRRAKSLSNAGAIDPDPVDAPPPNTNDDPPARQSGESEKKYKARIAKLDAEAAKAAKAKDGGEGGNADDPFPADGSPAVGGGDGGADS